MKPKSLVLAQFSKGVIWPVLILGVFTYLAISALPPSQITIYTAPAGTHYDNAVKYQKLFATRGVTLDIIKVEDITNLDTHVAKADGPPALSFAGTPLSADRYPRIRAAGVTQLQPMFVFYNKNIIDLTSLVDLSGHNICLPPQLSITSQMAVSVLSPFGITETNAAIFYLPLRDVISRLKSGTCDASIIILAIDNPIIAELTRQPHLRIADFRKLPALKRSLLNVEDVVISQGSFDIKSNNPPQDIVTVAVPNTVIFRNDLNPELVYMLLDIMKTTHHPATMLSRQGEFPTLPTQILPPSEEVNAFYATGLPWASRELPYWLAAIVNKYLKALAIIFAVTQVFFAFQAINNLARLVGGKGSDTKR